MTDDSEVARIAEGLTKRSKRALPLIGDDWTNEGWDKGQPNPNDCYSLWWGRDYRYRLVENRLRDGTGVFSRSAEWQWRVTPLGLAVRAYLQSKGGASC